MSSFFTELKDAFNEGYKAGLRGLTVGGVALIEKIIKDEKVDASEVEELKLICRISKPEENLHILFEIHDHVHGHENDSSWEELFLDETTKFFMPEENSKRKLSFGKACILSRVISNSIKKINKISAYIIRHKWVTS